MNRSALTAFPGTERMLREDLAEAPIDTASFRRKLHACDLADCHGTCCYDGAYLSDEAADVIDGLATTEASFFYSVGLKLPKRPIVQGETPGVIAGPKTAVRQRPLSQMVTGYPAHFNDTACVFLTDSGQCGLQLLSINKGLHPWYYKPMACWLHPIELERDGAAVTMLPDETTDSQKTPEYNGYVSQTFCGRTCDSGRPAYELLQGELTFLGEIIGRDLVGELFQPSKAVVVTSDERQ